MMLLRSFFRMLVNALFPPSCLSCTAAVEQHGALCSPCWQQIDFIAAPLCDICGHPFEYEEGENVICASCIAKAPPYTRARAVFRYTDHSRSLITRFKYSDHTHTAPTLAAWMSRAGKELLEEADILVPVPLHRLRLLKRRYNQAALLCQHLSKHSHIPSVLAALLRTRNTPPQAELTRTQRIRNVAGAFIVNPRYQEQLKGKHIILIDDVMTTGATIHACTRTLKKAGARRVDILTLARRVR